MASARVQGKTDARLPNHESKMEPQEIARKKEREKNCRDVVANAGPPKRNERGLTTYPLSYGSYLIQVFLKFLNTHKHSL